MSGEAHVEEHADERWLITYADMITLLMVLFIVLFSMSQVDLDKYKKLKESLSSGFGGGAAAAVLDGGTGALDNAQFNRAAPATPAAVSRVGSGGTDGTKTLEQARVALAAALAGSGLAGSVTLRHEQRGLVVSIVSDRVLFEPGQAALRDEGHRIVEQLGSVVRDMPNPLSVEGHTDNLPISGVFPSNWELSTARASSVLRELVANDHVDVRRFTVTGYADQRPVASNATAVGRAANRRVEIVVLANSVPTAAPMVAIAPVAAIAPPVPNPVPMPVPNPTGGH